MNDYRVQQIIDREGGNFKPLEFLANRQRLKKEIIEHIVRWRNWHRYMFQITSAIRDTGSHETGLAIDGLIWRPGAWRIEQPDPLHIWRMATVYPWMGVGLYFDWDDGIGLHLDMIQPPIRERPLRWLRIDGRYYYLDLQSGEFWHSSGGTYSVISLTEAIENYG